jgi:hypothetical protein
MQTRRIINVVDAIATQGRLILHLDCRHNISVWAKELMAGHRGTYTRDAQFNCSACPDLPPPTKAAHQLWKEAGEP